MPAPAAETTSQETAPQETAASLFRDRRFLLLWLGQLISSLGDAALLLAIPLTIYTATHSKADLSYWAMATALPVLLLGMFAGVFVDRWDRRRTMIVADLSRAAAVCLLLRIHSPADFWAFYLAAFLVGLFSCFFNPARTALMAALLPRERLMQANAVSTSGMQIMQLVGPVLGAALLSLIGPRGVYGFDALTFLVSAGCIALVSSPEITAKRPRLFAGVWSETQEGLRYVATSQTMRAVLVLLTIAILGAGIYNTLEVAFAKDMWHVTTRQFAALMVCYGVGGIIGGLLVSGPLRRAAPPRLIAGAFALMAAAGVAFALSPNLIAGGAALLLFGLSNMLVNIPVMTLFQTEVTNEMRGRVTATTMLVARLAMLVAAAMAGTLSQVVPLRPLFVGLSVAYLLCAVLARPLLAPRSFAEQSAPAEPVYAEPPRAETAPARPAL